LPLEQHHNFLLFLKKPWGLGLGLKACYLGNYLFIYLFIYLSIYLFMWEINKYFVFLAKTLVGIFDK
jgi:hypothetical protein